MTAKETVRAGYRALKAAPLPSLVALAAAAMAVLVGALATRTARDELERALAGAQPAHAARALAIVLAGGAFAALSIEISRACALAAYGGSQRPFVDGLRRTPAMITIALVEWIVQASLLGGALAVVVRGLDRAHPAQAAAFATLTIALPLVLAVTTFLAARIALTLAGRGIAPGAALVRGYDTILRRFPSLMRLGARLLLMTLPLTVLALLAPAPLAAPCGALAGLWGYAALSAFVGRDPRLSGG